MMCRMIQNKAQKSQGVTKTLHKINLDPNIPEDASQRLLSFRKPKKLFRTLPIHTESCFIDQNKIHQEYISWRSKLDNCRSLDHYEKEPIDFVQMQSQKKEAIFDIYQDMRKHQMFAHSLPLTNKRDTSSRKKENLTLNLKQVENIRSKSEVKRVAISPSQFKNTVETHVGPMTIGFRPISRRNHLKIAKKEMNISVTDSPNQRCADLKRAKKEHKSLRARNKVNNTQLSKLFSRSSGSLFSQCLAGQYRGKSHLKSAIKPLNTLNFIKKQVYS